MTGIVLLALTVWCAGQARRAWGTQPAAIAGVVRAAPRPKLLVRLGRRAPGALLGLALPWACDEPTAARGARATGLDVADVPALRAGAAAGFGLVAVVALVAAGGPAGVIAALAVAGFGAAYPDLWLRAAARRRAEQVERAAPLALDLIATTVASGIDLDVALRGAGAAVSDPLRAELELAQRHMALGTPRRDELRRLAAHTGSPTLGGLALAVSLADRLGVPLSASLAAEAARARRERARTVEERAARASPKVLVVVVFVLVPAALIPILAAVALSVASAFGGSGL